MKPEGSTPAIISDHAYVPVEGKDDWGLCAHEGCGLAAAAHEDVPPRPLGATLPYRCPDCVHQGEPRCDHERA